MRGVLHQFRRAAVAPGRAAVPDGEYEIGVCKNRVAGEFVRSGLVAARAAQDDRALRPCEKVLVFRSRRSVGEVPFILRDRERQDHGQRVAAVEGRVCRHAVRTLGKGRHQREDWRFQREKCCVTLVRCVHGFGDQRQRLGNSQLHLFPPGFGEAIRSMPDHAYGQGKPRLGGMRVWQRRGGHQ